MYAIVSEQDAILFSREIEKHYILYMRIRRYELIYYADNAIIYYDKYFKKTTD